MTPSSAAAIPRRAGALAMDREPSEALVALCGTLTLLAVGSVLAAYVAVFPALADALLPRTAGLDAGRLLAARVQSFTLLLALLVLPCAAVLWAGVAAYARLARR